ncbi:amino acid--tRNA ligase-related protein [Spirochaeta africana]|uniref:Lysyl-tRNA synthetase (Class II) n=1 Tax=Spirochaeta africana (strain ATCC 700263 / DSM 8902 / Z-7692) TaxID=889378 RepID=H9UM50_SPIAZ|nr:amino acid--tRNA ligase-related protein [Spirochaeta africana]AFG38593.1 lysyl-tRNA synthetase (class II) [Spirochaeta africana DSM 8902]
MMLMQDIRCCVQDLLRTFFRQRGYREVETPSLAPAVIPEATIQLFETRCTGYHGSLPLFALPSPEYYMKQLLAQGSGSIFQISRCFRNAEVLTRQHNPEFSMLEWYTVDQDYRYNLSLQQDLIRFLCDSRKLWELIAQLPASSSGRLLTRELRQRLQQPIAEFSLQEAFRRWVGIDLAASLKRGYLDPDRPEEPLEDAFHRLLVDCVEPCIPADRPVALIDYPAIVPTTGRQKPGTPWTERWELYIGGMEIANCYTEAPAVEMEKYIAGESAAIAAAGRQGQADTGYADKIRALPACSGNALGIDRLLMQLTGERSIEGVILFPLHATILP